MPLSSIQTHNMDQEEEEELLPGQKPKTLPCRYCQKRFRRLEHVQRHERTHTKEKPFKCRCGKTFGRRDLLVRHEKLVHLSENTREARNNSISSNSNSQPIQHPPPPPPTVQQPIYQHQQTAQPSYQQHQLQPPPPATPAHPHSHLNQPNMLSVPSLIDPDLLMAATPTYGHRTPGCSLDLLSDAANHLASHELHNMSTSLPQMHSETRYPEPHLDNHYGNGPLHEPHKYEETPSRNDFPPIGSGFQEDYNMFLDDVGGMSNYFLPSSAFDSDVPVSLWSKPDYGQSWSGYQESRERLGQETPGAESNSFSRFGSRLPSLQPETQDFENGAHSDYPRGGPPWKISGLELREIQRRLDDFNNVLPKGFVLPSRHTLSRFLEGYINGFHEHLPFLHLPTFCAVNIAPELLLALAAVGAQYRFESHRGNGLWYAAKAVALEQVRRRNSQQVLDILSPSVNTTSNPTSNPTTTSPQNGIRSIDNHYDFRGLVPGDNDSAQNDPRLRSSQARLETIQALLLLMAMGTWAPRALLREALSLQSILALLVREQGLNDTDMRHNDDLSWEDWVKIEGDKRTKFIVYSFFNLHCIAYDMTPLLLTSEFHLDLPQSAKEWKAETSTQWREMRRVTAPTHVSFHSVLGMLFSKASVPTSAQGPPMSSLGNYILIHAIIQHIFFLRQTSSVSHPATQNNGLLPPTQDEIGQALKHWQAAWERTPESSLDPSNPYGPVAFNSTALLRLAYIRLHSDLGPCRRLDTRDPIRIAQALKGSPLLERGGRLSRAVLQSAHALSIPVKIGVNYVARTQTFSWSIQHGLCNLECAFLLSKWLETIAQSPLDLTSDEVNLLDMVRSMLDETEFAVDAVPNTQTNSPQQPPEEVYPVENNSNIDSSLIDATPLKVEGRVTRSRANESSSNNASSNSASSVTGTNEEMSGIEKTNGDSEAKESPLLSGDDERKRIRKLGAAVVRLWAETFKGTHIFAVVKVIGTSLEVYAELLERECGN